MSKERARAREARQAARAAEVARAAAERERRERKAQRRAAVAARVPTVPRRRRRFGALPTRVRLGLAFGWLGAQLFAWLAVPDGRTRFGIALFTLAALPLVVVLTRDPRRSP